MRFLDNNTRQKITTASQDRRRFLQSSLLLGVACGSTDSSTSAETETTDTGLQGVMGIVSASAAAQLSGQATGRRFDLLEIPQILSEELDMTVLDLNTSSFPSFNTVDLKYIDRLRSEADKFGCVLTNLKMNQRGLDMNSPDPEVRTRAISEYKRSIDIAAQLGCRWARPLPQKIAPQMDLHVASYQELCDYAAQRNVKMLVENFGWMQADPNSVQKLVKAIGRNVAAGVDTGNWNNNQIRYAGLEASFPVAVTCDFKARKLGPNGEHAQYDLKRCFEIAWTSGFRGPWAFEHANFNTKEFFRELQLLRDMLRRWTAAAAV